MSVARTERLLNLLTLLLNSRRPIALREIREMDEFAAYRTEDPRSGERAFERDKAALIELGVPLRWVPPEQVEDEDDGVGGYVVDRDRYYLPTLELEPTELALLSLAGSAAAAIQNFPGRAAVVRALAKLGFDVDETAVAPSLAHAPMLEGVDPKLLAENLALVHHAVSSRHSISMFYRKTPSDVSERRVDPYGLYYRRGAWYLVAHCHLRDAERTFHLARIRGARCVGTPGGFDIPTGFSLRTHVDRRPFEFPSHSPVRVQIRLAPRLVPAVRDIFGPCARVNRDGEEVTVELKVTHRAALIRAVLPFGADAEVLSPAELRDELREIYRQLLSRYRRELPEPGPL